MPALAEIDGMYVWALIVFVFVCFMYFDFLLMRLWDYIEERLSKWKR